MLGWERSTLQRAMRRKRIFNKSRYEIIKYPHETRNTFQAREKTSNHHRSISIIQFNRRPPSPAKARSLTHSLPGSLVHSLTPRWMIVLAWLARVRSHDKYAVGGGCGRRRRTRPGRGGRRSYGREGRAYQPGELHQLLRPPISIGF